MVSPTPYPEVNAVLEQLLPSVRSTLEEQLAGAYLFGSLTTGEFDRESDVDILFATSGELSESQFAALQAMHERIAELDSWCATQLEVSYIPLAALRRYDPSNNLHPRLDRGAGGTLYWMRHDSDWVVQRHLLRERGITLWGPPPASLIDSVSADDLRRAMWPILEDWLVRLHEKPGQIRSRGYQSYIVLTVCRVLYTLQHGEVTSKRLAAQWAAGHLDSRWAGLIDRAWVGRQNSAVQIDAADADLNETFDFIQYAHERSRKAG
ncbi:MAG: aminoglycoside adenylyltransferase domain-containing protein [Bacteroidota bacterium]